MEAAMEAEDRYLSRRNRTDADRYLSQRSLKDADRYFTQIDVETVNQYLPQLDLKCGMSVISLRSYIWDLEARIKGQSGSFGTVQ